MKNAFFAVLAALTLFAVTGCPTDSDTDPIIPNEGPFTVTFDKNNTDTGSTNPSPLTRVVTPPATAVSALPTIAPTRPGFIFVGYNTKANGTGSDFTTATPVIADITVYAQWKIGFLVTFDKNNTDADSTDANPKTIEIIDPATTVVTLPSPPVREGYKFNGWNLNAAGDGPEFKDDTFVPMSITVFACWEFAGGKPNLIDGAIVHINPLMEISGNADMDDKGMITFSNGGMIRHTFPVTAEFDANDFDYFVISRTASAVAPGNPDSLFRRIGGGNYVGPGTISLGNMNPWVTNDDWLIRTVAGAGDTGGFQISHGSSNFTLKFNSITFYKAPRFTVTFNYNDAGNKEGATANKVVPNVWGKDSRFNGFGVTAANWPNAEIYIDTEETEWKFLGWYDDDNNEFKADTPITANITLKAKWIDSEPPKEVYIVHKSPSVGVYQFDLTGDQKLGQLKSVTFKALAPAAISGNNLRGHVIYVPSNTPTSGVWFNTEWGGGRIITGVNSLPFSDPATFSGKTGEWVTFTWAYPSNPVGEWSFAAEANASAAARTGLVSIGIGLASANDVEWAHFIKDVAITLDVNGTDVKLDARELDETTIGWVTTSNGFNGGNAGQLGREAVRTFNYFMYD